MSNYYTNIFKLDTDNHAFFEADRKQELSTLEKIGLESVLDDFVKEYETEEYGETRDDFKQYIRYNSNGVDILDGYTDTYIFSHYAISEVWTTNNGCLMMSAVDLDQYTGDDEDEREDFERCDLFDRPSHFDIWSDCEPVLFRLN